MYGVYDKPDQIKWDELPDKFVIKCNHDSGSTHLVDKGGNIDRQSLFRDLECHLKTKYGYDMCETHYFRINPKIIVEEWLPLSKGQDSSSQIDYKFWCFNGHVHCCFVCYDRIIGGKVVFDLYKINPWAEYRKGLSISCQNQKFKDIPAPENLDLMISLASELSVGFPQVRIDLYEISGKVYFGEMTFTSMGGRMRYFSNDFLKEMGALVDLTVAEKK